MTDSTAPAEVFTSPRDPGEKERMRHAHTTAATALAVRSHGPEVWGCQSRTLSRRASDRWLRVVGVPKGKQGGKLWDGTAAADARLPHSVPRPQLHNVIEWTGGGYVYRAELSEHLPRPALQAGGPVLTKELDLSDGGGRICAPRSPPPPRCPPTVRPYASGGSTNTSTGSSASPFQVTAWNTGHGDLHWANLTGPELVILDWEGWGRMPTGYDIGLLHALSLTQPATAARIRTEFAHVLESPGGRNGELVALAQLLQVVGRGRHRDLAGRLTGRAQQLTGTPVPTPTA